MKHKESISARRIGMELGCVLASSTAKSLGGAV